MYQDLKRFVAQKHRIVICFDFLTCRTILSSQQARTAKKWVKIQKSTDKHSSFDGLIQEDLDLSEIFLAITDTFYGALLEPSEQIQGSL